ncbi:MAG: serine/threonine-protein kinase [Acidobacteria bacterium]|nr:serine/threonine-protein kinase [Acidobacteriota bacterium]
MPEIGQTISHYKIVEKIGQGGMGEVYLADDTTLDRKVALKFLPDAFTSDPERMARFEREAKLLASLNHPNIAGIHGLEQADGNRFLVLEYVEGVTLQARLSKGALPLEDALEICRQIAEGLEAAHEKGVIHRDLKPANVMITAEEKVKILDFGLAKALSDDSQSIDSSQSPTLTEAMTQPGVILGTAAYMSPEQAKGKSVDKRADIWAFGCILYECLTGKRAFEGETVTEMLAAVIKEEPDIEPVPDEARQLLRQCLEKDRKNRLRDIGDAMAWIGHAPETVKPELLSIKHPWFAWSVAVVCFAGIVIISALYVFLILEEAPEMRLQVVTPPTSELTSFAISPDGRRLVFVARNGDRQMLWLRSLDAETSQPLQGTEGAINPFWKPDSHSVGFFAGGKLKRIDISGGNLQELASVHGGYGGTWNSDGVIVFAPSYARPLYRIPESGGDPVETTQLDKPHQIGHVSPQFMPDGRHLIFLSIGQDEGVYFTSLDSSENKRVIELDSPAYYTPPGYLVFLRQDTLVAQPFEASRGDLSGDAIPITDSPIQDTETRQIGFSASESGLLVYRTGSGIKRKLAWFDRDGNELGSLGPVDENNLLNPELSPDGKHVLVSRVVQGNPDVFLIDDRGIPAQITSDPNYDGYPIFSDDGKRIFFCSSRNGLVDLYEIPADGSGDAEILLDSPQVNKYIYDRSKDGRFLIYSQNHPETTGRDLYVYPLSGEEESFVFLDTENNERDARFSPDGEWVAYESDETGQYEVYVKKYPDGSRKQISNNGGLDPRWHSGGKELFYIAPDGRIMAVAIELSDQMPDPDKPVELFHPNIVQVQVPEKAQYAVASDGRFLINIEVMESTPSPITIVLNWAPSLKK